MKIAIHAVGRMKAGPERELADRYFDRFAKAGPSIGLEFAGIVETPESRAQTASERRAILEGIAYRAVDIVLGTHALFQSAVEFADLGLVVVDELQRARGVEEPVVREPHLAHASHPELTHEAVPRCDNDSLGSLDHVTTTVRPPPRTFIIITRCFDG